MLIFIGVLFTCVIPLFLHVNQVNSVYDQTVVDMKRFDENREEERIDVYAYPLSTDSQFLNIYMMNKCPLSVKIVRVWVNNIPFEYSFDIPAMEDRTIESVDISKILPNTEIFNIKVTTFRGKIFPSLSNPLYYRGGWTGGGLTIQIVVETQTIEKTRFFHIIVTDDCQGNPSYTYETDVVKRPHQSSCLAVATVYLTGTYYVTVKEAGVIIPPENQLVVVSQNNPSKWVYFYA